MNDERYSQIGQELFVLNVLKEKQNGLFLDIGCSEPVTINNTYLLEKKYNWSGISIDFDPQYASKWQETRKNKFTLCDAFLVDYGELLDNLLKETGRDRIDYLSMDLEPPSLTLDVLYKIPIDKYRFSVITYEHDYYRGNENILEKSREYFIKNNYSLVGSNIGNQEDWWIDSTFNYNNI
jgi:hypothetical protein